MVITKSKVVDFKLSFGEVIKSNINYPDWPTDVQAYSYGIFDPPLNTFKTIGYVYKNLFNVVGGSQRVN